MSHLHTDAACEKADVIPRQCTACFAFSRCGDVMNFCGNCRYIAANCCDNPDKLRFLGRDSSHLAASFVCKESPPELRTSIGVVTLTGFAVPDTKETGQPEGCPANITIDLARILSLSTDDRKRDTKKDAIGVCVASVISGLRNPAPDFADAL